MTNPLRPARYQNGDDVSKWWICKTTTGKWYVMRPSPGEGPYARLFSTGAEALAAFAKGGDQ